MSDQIDPLAILSRAPVTRHLPLDALTEIAGGARVLRYPLPGLLWQRGATPNIIVYIVEGAVEFSLTTLDGREANIPPSRPGEWMSWPVCLVDDALPYDIRAAAASVFMSVPKSVTRKAVIDNSAAMLEAFTIVSNSARGLMRWHFANELVDDERRLARLLAHLGDASRVGEKDEAIVRMTQDELSRLGFGARHRARRGLKSLQDHALIELQYGQVFVPSVTALRDYGFAGSVPPPRSHAR